MRCSQLREETPRPSFESIVQEPNGWLRLIVGTGHPSPLPPVLAGRIGRSRWTESAAPYFFCKGDSRAAPEGARNATIRDP